MVDALALTFVILISQDAPVDGERGQRWEQAVIDLRVAPGDGAPDGLFGAVERAAAAWGAVGAGPHIEVARGDEPVDDPLLVDGVSRIGVMREPWPYPAQAGAAAVAWASTTTDVIFEADIALNPAFDFRDPQAGGFDLISVVTHEMGHALGLRHLDDLPEATMYPLIPPGETKKRDLSDDDVAALVANYQGVAGEPPHHGAPTAGDSPALVEHDGTAADYRDGSPVGGCAQAGHPASAGALLLALFAVGRARRPRR